MVVARAGGGAGAGRVLPEPQERALEAVRVGAKLAYDVARVQDDDIGVQALGEVPHEPVELEQGPVWVACGTHYDDRRFQAAAVAVARLVHLPSHVEGHGLVVGFDVLPRVGAGRVARGGVVGVIAVKARGAGDADGVEVAYQERGGRLELPLRGAAAAPPARRRHEEPVEKRRRHHLRAAATRAGEWYVRSARERPSPAHVVGEVGDGALLVDALLPRSVVTTEPRFHTRESECKSVLSVLAKNGEKGLTKKKNEKRKRVNKERKEKNMKPAKKKKHASCASAGLRGSRGQLYLCVCVCSGDGSGGVSFREPAAMPARRPRRRRGGATSQLEQCFREAFLPQLRARDSGATVAFNRYRNVGGRRMFPDLECAVRSRGGELVRFLVEVDGTPHYAHVSKLRGRGPRRPVAVFRAQVARDDCLMDAVLGDELGGVRLLFRVPETAKTDFFWWASYIVETVCAVRPGGEGGTARVFLLDYRR
eukprot:3936955-Rhodomonas_salina.1